MRSYAQQCSKPRHRDIIGRNKKQNQDEYKDSLENSSFWSPWHAHTAGNLWQLLPCAQCSPSSSPVIYWASLSSASAEIVHTSPAPSFTPLKVGTRAVLRESREEDSQDSSGFIPSSSSAAVAGKRFSVKSFFRNRHTDTAAPNPLLNMDWFP